jgi:hypothetical protein
VEELGAGSKAERVQAFSEAALELFRSHRLRLRRPIVASVTNSSRSGWLFAGTGR